MDSSKIWVKEPKTARLCSSSSDLPSPSKKKRSSSSCSGQEVEERKRELINKVSEASLKFNKEESKINKLVKKVAKKCPEIQIWAEKEPDLLVNRIEDLCAGVSKAEAVSIAACFLTTTQNKGSRMASSTISNELLQYSGCFSYQSKGAAALRSPIDPNLPSRAHEPLPWPKDKVISAHNSREATLEALMINDQENSEECPFRLEMTSAKPTIGSLRPDSVLIMRGHRLSDLTSIGAFINLKSTTDGRYDSDECVGKVVIYGQEFLQHVGPERKSIVVGVTDLQMITLFRVIRANDPVFVSITDGFTYLRGEPSSNVVQVLSACLQAEPVSLDVKSGAYWQSLLLSEATNWKYKGYLGHGRTSYVHQFFNVDTSKLYALKWAREGHTLDNDIKFLKELAGIDGIPQIFQEFDGDSSKLVLEPVGESFTRKNLRRHYPAVIDLSKLVDTLESAHRKNIVNRDIRSENIMIARSLKDGQLRLFLLDWGFATTSDVADNFAGSLITASNSVLSKRIEDRGTECLYTFADDLVSLVRCLFLFYQRHASVSLYDDPKSPKHVLDFWEKAMNLNKEWQQVEKSASHLDYASVRNFLMKLQAYGD